MSSLTDWFESPTIIEGDVDEIQFALAVELIDAPGKRELLALLKRHGWVRVHRTKGHVYCHPSKRRLDAGEIYSRICKSLKAEVAAAQLAGDHSLMLSDLRMRVAVRSGLKGQIDRSDFEAKADRAMEAMWKRFEGWGYERGEDKALRFTYRPTVEQKAKHVEAGLTLP